MKEFALILCAVVVLYLAIRFRTRSSRVVGGRIRRMMAGFDFLVMSFAVFLGIIAAWLAASFGPYANRMLSSGEYLALGLLFIFGGLMFFAGHFLIVLSSHHLRIAWRALFIFAWWVPLLNIFVFAKTLGVVHGEYKFEKARETVVRVRAENAVCATKYPILLVHGIFFRDWQLLNCWGRIPRELTRCGARIYYGGQQSAAPIYESAAELAAAIRKITEETGCEKVNIIAHSKGGLDARYAISRLGMAQHVASLTTINTPHHGCVWVRMLLEKTPKGVLNWVASRYNRLYKRLGDAAPDFLGGLRELTDDFLREFNSQTPDAPQVYYQSVMSLMSGPLSVGFPLNIGYMLVKKYDKEQSDGLVARSSARWGNFLGEVTTKRRRGISHGDMIDLFREDIKGFDVVAFYVKLAEERSINN